MKTILIFTALTIILLMACKKDHVCQCGRNEKIESTVTYHDTKRNAKKKCLALQVSLQETGCNIK